MRPPQSRYDKQGMPYEAAEPEINKLGRCKCVCDSRNITSPINAIRQKATKPPDVELLSLYDESGACRRGVLFMQCTAALIAAFKTQYFFFFFRLEYIVRSDIV